MAICGVQTTAKDTPFLYPKLLWNQVDGAWFYSWDSFPVMIRLLAYSQPCISVVSVARWSESPHYLSFFSLFRILCTLSRLKIQCPLFWNLLVVQNKAVDFVKSYFLRLLSVVKICHSLLDTLGYEIDVYPVQLELLHMRLSEEYLLTNIILVSFMSRTFQPFLTARPRLYGMALLCKHFSPVRRIFSIFARVSAIDEVI